MRPLRAALLLIVASFLVAAPLLVSAQPKQHPRDVSKLFGELCASCHGPKLTGAQAKSLLDDTWAFGGDDASLAKSIKDGHPAQGMPPMGNALSEQEIRAMVIYIRENAAKAKREATTFAKPAAETNVQSEKHAFKLQTVVEGVKSPWSISFLPDGRMPSGRKEMRLISPEAASLTYADPGSVPLKVTPSSVNG